MTTTTAPLTCLDYEEDEIEPAGDCLASGVSGFFG